MIVDHLVTRSVIRSVGLVLAAIVPLATGYFLYMLVYKETPLDTFLTQLPLVLQLVQSNATTPIPSSQKAFFATASPSPLTTGTMFPFSSIITTSRFVSPHLSSLSSPSSSSNNIIPLSLSDSESITLSPAMGSLVALVTFLESRGYRDPVNIPGYQYLIALQPLRAKIEPWLDPILSFVATHQTLAWIIFIFHFWMATELMFFIHFWTRLRKAQEVDRVTKGPKGPRERRELFQRCNETIGDGDSAKKWVETWFDTGRTARPAKFEEIGRDNFMQWLAWSYWAAPIEEVLASPSDRIELSRMVDTIEETKNIKFAEGFKPVECIRLAFDPVIASHRPLIYYALVWVANVLAGFILNMHGFTRIEGTVDRTHTFERSSRKQHSNRPAVDPSTDLSYWIRTPVNPENKVPLVFIHGIGVGLAQYIHWVVALSTISRPVIVIEIPYVANKLVRRDCMSPDETYFAIERILKTHRYPKATFMGHSLGTMICAAVCRASPASSPKSIVAGLILADPICFLTHHSIARNFAYRVPSTASELIMDLFAARELGTSWYIMRRFSWDQVIFFPHCWKRRFEAPLPLQGKLSPVLPKKTRVFLSRKDNLLDMDMIADYLKTNVGLREEKEELHVMEDMDHAQFLLRPAWFCKVLKAAQEC